MNKKKIIKLLAIICPISGMVILISSIWPIISYKINQERSYQTLLTPIELDENVVKTRKDDYTKASNWFPTVSEDNNFLNSKVSFYTISIPKLNIENAIVTIGGEDLSSSLVQYSGTALPGKNGNSVVFGHSILPIFYNPKNYMSIFSTLPTLKNDDDIYIKYDNIDYKFKVEEIFEIFPTDIQILEQDFSDSFITLVTCVPPGDPRNPKRLIVRARIVS